MLTANGNHSLSGVSYCEPNREAVVARSDIASMVSAEHEAIPIRRLAERVRSFSCLWHAIGPLLGHKQWPWSFFGAAIHTRRMPGSKIDNDAQIGNPKEGHSLSRKQVP
jgi:hypothetical protein